MICCYVDELKEGFFPWIDQVARTLVPLLKFYFHEDVRKAVVSAMPDLLRSAKLAVEKGQSQGRNESYVKQLLDYIIPALVEALHKEPKTEIFASMLDSLNECAKICGPLLDENQVKLIVEEIKIVIAASFARKKARAERSKAEDFDEEERELLKEENEQEEDLFNEVGDLLGTLIKLFKVSFLPFFEDLSPHLTPMLDNITKKLTTGDAASDELGAKHGPNWLKGRCFKSGMSSCSNPPTETYVKELTTRIKESLASEVEEKMKKVESEFEQKMQRNLAFALKKLGEANLDITVDVEQLCAIATSEADDGTPITGGSSF